MRYTFKMITIYFFIFKLIHAIFESNTDKFDDENKVLTIVSHSPLNHGNVITKVSNDHENILHDYLLIITLDGTLHLVNKTTGHKYWTTFDKPLIKINREEKNENLKSIFVPDPKDGSLYFMSDSNKITKLPFSIPQLVSNSPSYNNDGKLLMGKKEDEWMILNPNNGDWVSSVNVEKDMCPFFNNHIFIGKIEYTIMMYDHQNLRSWWNITYLNYVSNTLPSFDVDHYGPLHLASASSGLLVTFEKDNDLMLWHQNFESPVVGIYLLYSHGLVQVPFTSVELESLYNLITHDKKRDKKRESLYNAQMHFIKSLYLGSHSSGLYILPSLIDSSSSLIQSDHKYLLLEGPKDEMKIMRKTQLLSGKYYLVTGYKCCLGYYHMPQYPEIALDFFHPLNNKFNASFWSDYVMNDSELQTDIWIYSHEKLFILIHTFLIFISIFFVHFWKKKKETTSLKSKDTMQIGKIEFDMQNILGRGCHGTLVYKGKFDNREVAVKRLISDYFTFAEREAALLRESDYHPNVIRYFCTERDQQFQYIALELCIANVQQYIEEGIQSLAITPLQILNQATIHRDIKPHNVLLCKNNVNGGIKALISDFGFCKKLSPGHLSFSCCSGIAGTDGWIAPEMYKDKHHVTTAVDIFSLGCVFFYVLSNGKHPFGNVLKRQANIIANKISLIDLHSEEHQLSKRLIETMLNNDPTKRPLASSILQHPLFWNKTKILHFFQDVSDYVEKEKPESSVLHNLENNSTNVIKGNWRVHIDKILLNDLNTRRTYCGKSVRDLLRAFRNKKNHFRELSSEVLTMFGSHPDAFVDYWLSKFPNLLQHTWFAMQIVSYDSILSLYYPEDFIYPQHSLSEEP